MDQQVGRGPGGRKPGAADVPFVKDWRDRRTFPEVRGSGIVDDADEMLAGFNPEAAVHEDNTVQAALVQLLADARRAVARLHVPGGASDWQGEQRIEGWGGTGFLVAPTILLTNHHVVNSRTVARKTEAEFNYEISPDDLRDKSLKRQPATIRVRLDPDRLFLTSRGLDYTFVWVEAPELEALGHIAMRRSSFRIKPPDPTFIIQHPNRGLKVVALDDTELLSVNETALLYAADTDEGSSGAPVLDETGQLVALHHAWREASQFAALYGEGHLTLTDDRPVRIANEGIKIAAIAIDLEARINRREDGAQAARAVLRHIHGSDTMSGVLGALGREIAPTGEGGADVLAAYRATDQDFDVGVWNLSFLTSRAFDPEQFQSAVEGVARAFADLNQDLWCVVGCPRHIVATIVEASREVFRQRLAVAGGQVMDGDTVISAFVIYRDGAVSLEAERWPAQVERMLSLTVHDLDGDSEDEAPIFPLPPSRWRLVHDHRGRCNAFTLVAADLSRGRSGPGGRDVASEVLGHMLALCREDGAARNDLVVAGRFDASVLVGALEEDEASLPGATGAASGSVALAVASGARTCVRQLFTAETTERFTGHAERWTKVEGRSVGDYVKAVTDTLPIVARLSLKNRAAAGGPATPEFSLRDVLRTIIRGGQPVPPAPSPAPAPSGGGAVPVPRPKPTGAAEPVTEPDGTTPPDGGDGDRPFVPASSKSAWFRDNRPALARLVSRSNGWLAGAFGGRINALTLADVFVVFYSEGAFRGGNPDAAGGHSLGERGFLPLPDNITFWIGGDAPAWDRPMSLAENMESYARYLGALKNKRVVERAGYVLYRGLFEDPQLAGNDAASARLLAGVVHGYFVSSNYRSRTVPFDHLLGSYARGVPLAQMMARTDYVHAGTGILRGRERNIETALDLLA